jgi:hypothetical protein
MRAHLLSAKISRVERRARVYKYLKFRRPPVCLMRVWPLLALWPIACFPFRQNCREFHNDSFWGLKIDFVARRKFFFCEVPLFVSRGVFAVDEAARFLADFSRIIISLFQPAL